MRSGLRRIVLTVVVAAGAVGCAPSGTGHRAGPTEASRPGTAGGAGTRPSVIPGPAATPAPPATDGPKATAAPTTAPSPTDTRASSAPFKVRELSVPLVDRNRPTVGRAGLISHSRALTTRLWVPDEPGRWPLVVFGPGYEVGPDPYEPLLKAWAAHGYVVAAVEFPLTDAAVAGPNLDENDIVNQPADLRFVTDALVGPTSPVAAEVDARRVAVAGHSDGAEDALDASIQPAPRGQPAYRAVIVMSGQPLVGIATTPNPPILVIQGDADPINAPSRGYRTWEVAASPKDLEVLHGAGHLPPLGPGSEWLPILERVTGAFLDAYVAGDESPAAITEAGNDPPLADVRTG